MNKRILTSCSFLLLLTFTSYSQEKTSPAHVTPTAVTANPKLKSLSENIGAKEAAYHTASRAQLAALGAELTQLRQDYKTALEAEIAASKQEEARRALRQELLLVEQQLEQTKTNR